ncbi:protein-tyrosine phosphatase/membrane-associated phospholipid phosphatase [Pseudomonas nitritireducens]|uniref:Protein-tyrosine phosphatase/membrane-associated phospholipid phosphatase n=1 Tax=Pseudomonas nitroreducens TaxID=46680 RepID=A0A7W7NZ32_PSENT|nr:phosphatase PAP2/dual specificity phosphatase family protein [Pseudomonas nitritireducens]MBB4862056.1 protein-tyrosine phosphatase/membrane-associated phospholipid phosphatase [Pseudomonas nitritireducens]
MASLPLREPGVLRRAVIWLLCLGPFFFLSYGFANWVAGQRESVGVLVFDWERGMPLWPWTIIPYWSIDLLYGLSFLLPRTRRGLDCHALRLLTAQVVAVACFLLFPLRFSFERPMLDGFFGLLFDLLMGFDKPFNQAPSLHIALLVILWVAYGRYAQGFTRWLLHGWFALIGLSVLTTWQHHFIDVPTGALLGFFCVWLWPREVRSPWQAWSLSDNPQRRRLAGLYAAGSLLCLVLALAGGGPWLWLCWPAVSLALVVLCYLGIGPVGFQKRLDGRHSTAVAWLLAPYWLGAWLNARWWTRHHPQPDEVLPGLWLGRLPDWYKPWHLPSLAILDLCAELPCTALTRRYDCLPWLDLVAPSAEQCRQGAELIDQLHRDGPLLVCCALGYSRSATLVAAWLLISGRSATVEEALALIRQARPQVVLKAEQRAVLAQIAGQPHLPEEVSHAG